MASNDRFLWGVEVLKLKPDHRILEIGCGAGLFLDQISQRLDSGSVTGIDKSTSMLKLAQNRNQLAIRDGKVNLVNADFLYWHQANLYDKIIAFNVNIFWQRTETALQQIRILLKPSGSLYVFYQLVNDLDAGIETRIEGALNRHNFTIQEVQYKRPPGAAFCILARPK